MSRSPHLMTSGAALPDDIVAIHKATRSTVFMLTHDTRRGCGADKVLLLTTGPKAWIAELIEHALPAGARAHRAARARELLSAAQ